MPDTTMCMNDLCPLGPTCRRLTAEPSEWQSYAMFNPRYTAQGPVCDDYIPTHEVRVSDRTEVRG